MTRHAYTPGRRWACFACAIVLAVVTARGDQGAQSAPAKPKGDARLDAAEAVAFAKAARQKADVEVPDGIELTLWASERLITDPIAIDVDPAGTAYVISSSRADLPLDIRGHSDWLPTVHTLKSTQALLEFYRKDLAPDQ